MRRIFLRIVPIIMITMRIMFGWYPMGNPGRDILCNLITVAAGRLCRTIVFSRRERQSTQSPTRRSLIHGTCLERTVLRHISYLIRKPKIVFWRWIFLPAAVSILFRMLSSHRCTTVAMCCIMPYIRMI